MNRVITLILAATSVASAATSELPDAPRVVDKPFIAALAMEAGAISVDMATTALVNGRKGSCFTFKGGPRFGQTVCSTQVVERDPWFGDHPSNARLVIENLGIFGAEATLAYQLKRPHPRLPWDRIVRHLWWLPLAYQSQMHIRLGIHNLRLP